MIAHSRDSCQTHEVGFNYLISSWSVFKTACWGANNHEISWVLSIDDGYMGSWPPWGAFYRHLIIGLGTHQNYGNIHVYIIYTYIWIQKLGIMGYIYIYTHIYIYNNDNTKTYDWKIYDWKMMVDDVGWWFCWRFIIMQELGIWILDNQGLQLTAKRWSHGQIPGFEDAEIVWFLASSNPYFGWAKWSQTSWRTPNFSRSTSKFYLIF